MDVKFIILFSIVLVIFILNRLYVWIDEKRKRETIKEEISTREKSDFSNEENDEDDVIYDENKKTPEEAIKKYYAEDGEKEKEFVLMKNFLLDEGFRFQKFNSKEIDTLENTKLLSSYKDWSCGQSYHKDTFSFFIANVSSPNFRGRHSYSIITPVLVCWIKDFNFSGHYCFYRKGIVEYVIDIVTDDEAEMIYGYETVILKKSAMEKQLRSFLKTIQFDGDLEIEVHDSNIFIKVSNRASYENLLKLYQTIKNPQQ